MKTNHNLIHQAYALVRKELEITLAILILLAFVVGFSFADNSANPESSIPQAQAATEQSSNLIFDAKPYQGLTFGYSKPGFIRVNKFTGPAQYISGSKLTLVDSSATYSLTVKLDSELDGTKWYLDASADKLEATVNGQGVTSVTQPIILTGAKEIVITTNGGIDLYRFSKTPGSITSDIDLAGTVATTYIAPTNTTVTQGQQRNFIIVALDGNGEAVDAKSITNWSVSDRTIATVNPSTGTLIALAPGTIQVTAKVGNTFATATVTIQPESERAPIVNEPTKTAPNPIVVIPVDEKPEVAEETPEQTTDETPEPTEAIKTALDSLFSETSATKRIADTGNLMPNQAEINEAAAKLASASARLSFRINTAAQEIALTLKTIAVGSTVTDPTTGNTIKIPSAIEAIANFFAKLIS